MYRANMDFYYCQASFRHDNHFQIDSPCQLSNTYLRGNYEHISICTVHDSGCVWGIFSNDVVLSIGALKFANWCSKLCCRNRSKIIDCKLSRIIFVINGFIIAQENVSIRLYLNSVCDNTSLTMSGRNGTEISR